MNQKIPNTLNQTIHKMRVQSDDPLCGAISGRVSYAWERVDCIQCLKFLNVTSAKRIRMDRSIRNEKKQKES